MGGVRGRLADLVARAGGPAPSDDVWAEIERLLEEAGAPDPDPPEEVAILADALEDLEAIGEARAKVALRRRHTGKFASHAAALANRAEAPGRPVVERLDLGHRARAMRLFVSRRRRRTRERVDDLGERVRTLLLEVPGPPDLRARLEDLAARPDGGREWEAVLDALGARLESLRREHLLRRARAFPGEGARP